MLLRKAEADGIDARIAQLEARCDAQVVAAVVAKSDDYPEIVWKAFALGATGAALVVFVLDVLRPGWVSAYATLAHVLPIIGVGAASALGAVWLPAYARRFVSRFRAEAEVRQRAQALFLERQLFRTRARTGVLVLVSIFERRVEILADIGVADRVAPGDWQSIVDAMTQDLAAARPAEAIVHGLDRLEALLAGSRLTRDTVAAADALPNRPIEERDT